MHSDSGWVCWRSLKRVHCLLRFFIETLLSTDRGVLTDVFWLSSYVVFEGFWDLNF